MKKNLKYHGTLQTGGGCMSHFFSMGGTGLMIAMDFHFEFPEVDLDTYMHGDENLEPPLMEPMDALTDGTQITTFEGWTITLPFDDDRIVILDPNGDLAARFVIDHQCGHPNANPITLEVTS